MPSWGPMPRWKKAWCCTPECSSARTFLLAHQSVLMPGVVVLQDCRIGRRCRVHPNAVIGGDGFGYFSRSGVNYKIPHAGTVEIGDDVEIGACCCVDRAKFGVTRVGNNSKFDNFVQIGHGAQLGDGALLVAHTALGGSSKTGRNVVLGGHACIGDNVTVGDRCQIAAYSAPIKNIASDTVCGGMPAVPIKVWRQSMTLLWRLPELRRQLKDLQARINALESTTNDDR